MPGRTCLITGGNAGIGRAAATELVMRGAQVVIASRNRERGEQAVASIRRETGRDHISLVTMDLSSKQSIQSGCEAFLAEHARLDVLIHNAADFDISQKEPKYSDDGVETIWATNHVGPVFLTQQLHNALTQSDQARVITVASKGLTVHPQLKVNLDDPEFRKGGFRVDKAYYQSKLAQVMYTYWLAERFKSSPMTANCVRVTNVKIDIDRYPNISQLGKRLYRIKSRFSITPQQMAQTYIWLALSSEAAGMTGGYFDEKNKRVSSNRYSRDPDNIRRVMELTAQYVPGVLG